ncbi:MAG: Allergen family protein [Sediminibacterium sp.]|nr:Allergen family protein [Sediminibacterium sp.]
MFRFLFILLLSCPLISFSQISTIELEARYVPEPGIDSVVENWNRTQPGYDKLPLQAKKFLYWTNYSRNNPQKFWDSAIVPILAIFPPMNKPEAGTLKTDLWKAGSLPMFKLNEALIGTAQSHASDIGGKRAPLGHTSTNGADFASRMKKAGIKYCAAENISLSSQSILLSTILLYLDIGLPGLGHRKALLDPNLREIGIGSSLYNADQYFLVQDMSCVQK